MKTRLWIQVIGLCAGAAWTVPGEAPVEYTAHEWGTFTTMSGSDGVQLEGLYGEEEILPSFVQRLASGVTKGFTARGVTVKMETPILYFHAPRALDVSVRAGFNGGAIGECYPPRSGGETHDPFLVINLAEPRRGAIEWKVRVLAPDAPVRPTPDPAMVTPTWAAPRATAANLVQAGSGEIEHFLFYRGLGRFEVPLKTSFDAEERLCLVNEGTDAIPFAVVYDKRGDDSVRFTAVDGLAPGEAWVLPDGAPARRLPAQARALRARLVQALVAAGLFEDEAEALLATWWRSYFEADGLRVFWIVPRRFTDGILPLDIDPAPRDLVRVMVGRSEVLRPAFERELAAAFEAKTNPYARDRFAPAYRKRIEALAAVGEEAP